MLKEKLKLKIRYIQKFCLHRMILPVIYRRYTKLPVQNDLVLFADAKNDGLPFSMQAMYEEIQKQGYLVENWCRDFDAFSLKEKLSYLHRFMKQYAQARYVFICDYFLPISSCKKRKETKVIHLWHACGLLKKFGYDAPDDLGKLKGLQLTKNIDLWTVSSEVCVPVFEKATHLYDGQVQALGISRTDIYFSEEYRERCAETFYRLYPELVGKKLILWAPTFRDNAKIAKLIGFREIKQLQRELGNDYKILIKIHPHLAKQYRVDNCELPPEVLYPVVDLLITDYSSVLFEYSLFHKPFLIFAPDYDEYMERRGCYIDLEHDLQCSINRNWEELLSSIQNYNSYDILLNGLVQVHLSECDGNTIERILAVLKRWEKEEYEN